jgi:hypothetical protein
MKSTLLTAETNPTSLPTKRPFSWKVFLFLMALLVPATYAVLPYALTLHAATLEAADVPRLLLGSLVDVLIYAVLAGIGLFLAGRIGLGLPLVEGWLKKEPIWNRFRSVLVSSVIVGIVVSLLILGLAWLVFKPLMQAELANLGITLPEEIQPPAWQGFLASFYGGITEEVLLRLFLLTLFAWLGSLVSRDREGRPAPVVFWIANILAAVAFGLGHLPATVAIGLPLTALVITRALVLNGLGGLVFGWLYWKQGLESAILAHFSADIVLHVLFVLALPLLL